MNLKALAYQLRRDTIDIICAGKAGHIGGDMSVMENKANWHHKVPTQEEYDQIIADFAKRKEALLHE